MPFIKLKDVLASCLILCLLTYIGCSNNKISRTDVEVSPTTKMQVDKTQKVNNLTMEGIKKNYENTQNVKLVNITGYYDTKTKHDYALVEYINGADQDRFDWYNLNTGDKDELPLFGVNKAKLIKINNADDILFKTDGISTINGHKSFPQIVQCFRVGEAVAYSCDFYCIEKENYLEISQGSEIGVTRSENISDVKLSLSGVEILFEPTEGREVEFYAAYKSIPLTKTSYIKDKNQFIIEFENVGISPRFLAKNLEIEIQNGYITSLELVRDNQNCKLIISLKEAAKYFTAKECHLEPTDDGSPYVDFRFASEYKTEW